MQRAAKTPAPQSSAPRTQAGSSVATLQDNRAGAAAQRALVEGINASPRVAAQRALSASIHDSPRMAARPPLQRQAVRQLMTLEAAQAAQSGQVWVWVREGGDGPWLRGKIQDIGGDGTLTVDVGDGAIVAAPVAEVHNAPPPGASLDRRPQELAVIDNGPGTVAPSASAQASSPEVQQYVVLLAGLDEAQRKRQTRDLLMALHPDKGGSGEQFNFLKIAIDLVKNGPPPLAREQAPPLALTYGEMGQPQELPGQPFSAAEISVLNSLPLVHGPTDLARLANTGRTARHLVALAGMRTAATLDDLVSLAALPQPLVLLAQLDTLVHVHGAADLVALAASGRSFARLSAFCGLPQVTGLATLLQVAAIVQADADVLALAPLAQAATVANLQLLCTLVGPRLAADIVAIAGMGSATFVVPNANQIVQLCGLPKTAQQIVILAAQPGIANTAQLLTLAHETRDRDTAGETWYLLDARWEQIKSAWGVRWPLTGVFAALPVAWTVASQRVRAFVRDRANPAGAADLQAFALEAAAMKSSLDLIDQISPALDEGQQALGQADARLLALNQLITEIDNHFLRFYAAGTLNHATATAQRLLADNARTALNAERAQILLDQATYAGLGALTPAVVGQAALAQQAHTANIAAEPTALVLKAPLIPLRTAGYVERTTYPNLNLTTVQVAHPFWQSLQPVEKVRFNAKLQGFPVTNWAVQGYPGTRARQNGYAGAQIQIPTLAGFPVAVGGEVVHDWIFPSVGHGRSAQEMNVMLGHALAGTPLPSRLGPLLPDNQYPAGRTVYGFQNIAANIVVTNANVLITFYSTL